MDAKKILKADFLDLLFHGRNKKYGAYTLRKSYRKRLWMAVAFSIIFGFTAIWFLQPAAAESESKMVTVRSVVLENIEDLKPTPPPPPPPPKTEVPEPPKTEVVATGPKVTKPKIKTTKFTPPVIKKDKEVEKNEMPPVTDIATVDVVTSNGVNREELAANLPPVKAVKGLDKGTGIIQAPKKKKVDENKIFEKVEIEASVDMSKWRRHLERRLVRYIEDAAFNGMAPGKYTVNVRFVVEKNGNISKVKALNNPGYGLARGAEQVVKTGPKWKPGEQNGRKVRSYHTQPITFVIMGV